MADAGESGSDAQITFKVKTSQDGTHTITMAESATVLDLKTKLSTAEFENIPVDRQRLIYSGRVMKNDDALATYKIKPNNTIHMVKSAASNPSQPASTSTPTPQAIPSNMASGTANNPLANLTGARYAGHQINLPGMDMFGPDGGMGPPMDEERLQRMMSDPNVQQSMNEALNNPDFVNMLIDSNPMLRNIPNAREIISSPFMRQMMTNPQMMTQAMRMQRNMRGGEGGAFPAPGATDTTPTGAAANEGTGGPGSGGQADNQQQNPLLNPFAPGMMPPGMNYQQVLQSLGGLQNPFATPGAGQTGSTETTGQNTTENRAATEGAGGAGTTPTQGQGQAPPPANPFAALFPPAGAGGAGGLGALAGLGGLGGGANPFGITPEQLQQLLQLAGPGGTVTAHSPPPPADTRPPEERYAEQLRQLNDMGFYDFDRNVAALRRSGGSVQGAVEHLLSATD